MAASPGARSAGAVPAMRRSPTQCRATFTFSRRNGPAADRVVAVHVEHVSPVRGATQDRVADTHRSGARHQPCRRPFLLRVGPLRGWSASERTDNSSLWWFAVGRQASNSAMSGPIKSSVASWRRPTVAEAVLHTALTGRNEWRARVGPGQEHSRIARSLRETGSLRQRGARCRPCRR